MARSTSYNTRTRQLILDYLTANRRHAVSAADIVAHLEAEGERTNPTTVYRYLDHEHIHLKCTCCGEIFHMDCHFMDEVRQHLLAEHGFTLQCEGSILYGLCRQCAEKQRQKEEKTD